MRIKEEKGEKGRKTQGGKRRGKRRKAEEMFLRNDK